MKTAEEIKKGLECCSIDDLHCGQGCPYKDDCLEEARYKGLESDALAYIRQLEAERDAAVKDICLAFTSYVGACQTCKHKENQIECDNPLGCGYCGDEKCKCNSCGGDCSNWQWRGVQKEE